MYKKYKVVYDQGNYTNMRRHARLAEPVKLVVQFAFKTAPLHENIDTARIKQLSTDYPAAGETVVSDKNERTRQII